MRYLFAVLGAVGLSILIAACGASVGPSPVGNTAGAPAQSQSTQTYSVTTTSQFSLAAPSIGGNLANIEFTAASGGPARATMTVTASTTSSLPALSKARLPAALRNIKDFTYSAQWFYDVIASATLTFQMAPAWSVTVGQPISGASYFLAYYDPTIPGWNIYAGGNPQGTPGPTATNVVYLFTPAAVASPMVIPTGSPGANFALVAITGTTPTPVPTPTPPPASLPNLIADPNFANEGAAGQWSLNSSTGWTPCFDPEATPTPAATLAPAPTITTGTQGGTGLPYNGNTYAALTGQELGQATEPHEPRGSQGICQTITIPTNPYMWLYVEEGANDGSAYVAQRGTLILGGPLIAAPGSTGPNPTYYVSGATGEVSLFNDYTCTGKATGQSYDNCTGSDQPIQWVMKGPYTTVLQPYVGQQAVLYLGVWASGYSSSKSYGVYMYVDGVDLVSQP
jgi:hypothetical protein